MICGLAVALPDANSFSPSRSSRARPVSTDEDVGAGGAAFNCSIRTFIIILRTATRTKDRCFIEADGLI